MTDRACHVVCSALSQGSRPASVADKPFFKQLMATGLFNISDLFLGPISHKWVLSLVQPRRDEEGHLLGALGMPIDLVRFERVLGGVNLPEGGMVTMINATGRVLTRSRDPMIWVAKEVSAHDQGNLLALDIDSRERHIGFARVPASSMSGCPLVWLWHGQ